MMASQMPLSILHISSARTWRGGEQQIAYLVEELLKKGIEQHVLCVNDGALEAWCRAMNIPHNTYTKRSSIDIGVARKIKQLCLQNKHTIIHVHDSHAHTFACLSASIFRNSVPIVLHRRVDFPVQSNPLSHWKYNHSSIQRIICVSNAIKDILTPNIRAKHKLRVVHSGLDISRFEQVEKSRLREEFDIPKERILIGKVAAIAAHKDYFTFVDTVERLVKMDLNATYFIIGGDGGEQAAIENYIAAKQLQNHIILTGFRSDIPAILAELDVFLFTSKEEGLGTSVLDAFASRVPVVATRAGGIPEMVVHEQTGLLANIGDAETLATQVLRILKDTNLQQKLVENAYLKLEAFTKEKMATNILAIYQEINGHSRP